MDSATGPADRKTRPVSPQALYRGLYVRIARNLGVDPSYVSRVARGQRHSAIVEEALRRELDGISRKLRASTQAISVGPAAERREPSGRLSLFVKRDRSWMRREWLRDCQTNRILRSFPLSAQKRVSPILPLVEEAMRLSQLTPRQINANSSRAAQAHGRLRRQQRYSVSALVEEYHLLRRCISRVAEKHLHQMDRDLLFCDLDRAGEAIARQMQSALTGFLRRRPATHDKA
ncbi:MAG TPA: hypothetical protein VMT28_09730 [Terriglobales bacterium]|jgi:hypothetical protein|nr:hypothetical protein [Terriglobales bacterium]